MKGAVRNADGQRLVCLHTPVCVVVFSFFSFLISLQALRALIIGWVREKRKRDYMRKMRESKVTLK